MKLRGLERGMAEAVDMIPAPHLGTLTWAISTQHSADTAGKGSAQSEGRQGQLEVGVQTGRGFQETIINKAVSEGHRQRMQNSRVIGDFTSQKWQGIIEQLSNVACGTLWQKYIILMVNRLPVPSPDK